MHATELGDGLRSCCIAFAPAGLLAKNWHLYEHLSTYEIVAQASGLYSPGISICPSSSCEPTL
jgi:hypothetical protein